MRHSYTTAFWVAAAIFAVAAVVVTPLLRPGIPETGDETLPVGA